MPLKGKKRRIETHFSDEETEVTAERSRSHEGHPMQNVLASQAIERTGVTLSSPTRATTADAYAEGGMRFLREKLSEVALRDPRTERFRDAQINTWVKHLDDEEIVNLMETGKVIREEPIPDGISSKPVKLILDNGLRIIFKAASKDTLLMSHTAERSAYRVARRIHLGWVPPATIREHNGKEGSAQLWLDDLVPGDIASPHDDTVRFYDLLIANPDRKKGAPRPNQGFLASDHNRLVLFDHANAFSNMDSFMAITPKEAAGLKVRADVLEAARNLDATGLGLTPHKAKWLLIRRNTLIDAIDNGRHASSASNPSVWLEFKMDD